MPKGEYIKVAGKTKNQKDKQGKLALQTHTFNIKLGVEKTETPKNKQVKLAENSEKTNSQRKLEVRQNTETNS